MFRGDFRGKNSRGVGNMCKLSAIFHITSSAVPVTFSHLSTAVAWKKINNWAICLNLQRQLLVQNWILLGFKCDELAWYSILAIDILYYFGIRCLCFPLTRKKQQNKNSYCEVFKFHLLFFWVWFQKRNFIFLLFSRVSNMRHSETNLFSGILFFTPI